MISKRQRIANSIRKLERDGEWTVDFIAHLVEYDKIEFYLALDNTERGLYLDGFNYIVGR